MGFIIDYRMRGVFVLLIALFLISFVSAQNFQVNSLLVKVAVHDGEFVTRTIGLTANGEGVYSLSIKGISSVSLFEDQFSMLTGESKNIEIFFDSNKAEPGVYVGSLQITANGETQIVPIIFEIESKDVFVDLNIDIPPQYSSISPGEKVIAQIKLFDLTSGGTSNGLGATKVEADYYVYDIEGNVASSETESLILDKQAQITRSLMFPQTTKPGQYVFFAVVKYGSSVGTASHIFTIEPDEKNKGQLFSSDLDWKFFAVLIVIVLFFFGMIFFFIYLLRDRDKLILDLKKYNEVDFNKQKSLLLEQGKLLVKKGKISESKAKEEVKHKLEEVKKKHETRVKQMQDLRKKGDVKSMQKKMNEWKNEGYSTSALEYKMKGLSTEEMKSLLDKWRKNYGGRRV